MSGVDGLISGIPTAELIDSMIEGARGATRVTEQKKELYELRLESVRSLNTKLLSARLDATALKRPATFAARTASSSDSGVLGVTANSNAVPGTYSLNVVNIAQSHQLATAGQSSDSQIIGSGDIVLQVGNGTEATISVADASLQDIAAAINAEDMGLTASVVNDGQANPYRLIIQSNETGAANSITISGTDDLVNIVDQGQMDEISEALDAEISFGAGAGAITVKSTTNKVENLIEGVSIDLVAAGSANITVGSGAGEAETAITTFIESLNSAISYFKDNASYDSDNNEAGILFSENDVRRSIESLSRALISPVEGLSNDLEMFTAIGVSVNRSTGLFEIDSDKLQSVLSSNPSGVSDLFVNRGESSHAGVEFATMSDATALDEPFAIEITTAAARATVASLGDLAASTVINGSNSTFIFNVNNQSYTVELSEDTYTRSEMADHLEQVMNAAITSSGSKVEVNLNGDALEVQSKYYGSSQSISIISSAAQSTLNLSSSQALGVDVAGTINGTAVTGSGQVLQGVSGEGSEGLRLLVTAKAPVAGVTLDVYEGLGQRISTSMDRLINVDSGVITIKENSLTQNILNMEEQIAAVDERMDLRRARLQAEFLQMEKLMSQFNTQETFLQGQIAGFQNLAAARANK